MTMSNEFALMAGAFFPYELLVLLESNIQAALLLCAAFGFHAEFYAGMNGLNAAFFATDGSTF